MEKELFQQLLTSAKWAKAISKGKAKPSRVFRYQEKDILRIRENLKLSQAQFAQLLRIPAGTLRNWEQGRTVPDTPAQTLLLIADRHPAVLSKIDSEGRTVYKTIALSKPKNENRGIAKHKRR